jgi:6,7-dimethyl-8-ribityllumazine synthase
VIQGETDHYEHIAREASAGLAAVARETRVPVGFGVLTVRNEEQARVRSAEGAGNKGAEAARAAVAMVRLIERIDNEKTHRGPEARRRKKRARAGARGRSR